MALNLQRNKTGMHLRIILLLLGLATAQSSIAQTEWELEKSGDGIEIYTREIDEVEIKEFKAKTTIEANINDLIDALDAVDEHPDWMSDVSYARTLPDAPHVMHYNIKLPFPFKNRYVVMESEANRVGDVHRIEMWTSEMELDDMDGHVRIPYVKGYWQFTELDENTTEVVYQFVSDPGGKVPDWLVNAFVVQSPYKTLSKLRKRLE